MTAPLQQQITPGDHHYFEWSTSKQQTNHKHFYQNYDDNQLKDSSLSNDHLRKKPKLNESNPNDDSCYPFQAELTQKIDIECAGRSTTNTSCQTSHTPTHHFTLSTVINVSVNGQTQKLPSPTKSTDQQDHLSPLVSYSELNLYLKDVDLTTLDTFILPSCPNPQDYLTVDGLLTFLMSDKFNKRYQLKQTYPMNYPQTQYYRYPYQQYYNYPPIETGNSSYYQPSSLPQQTTRYYSNTKSTPPFR